MAAAIRFTCAQCGNHTKKRYAQFRGAQLSKSILTIPSTPANYSVLTVNRYCDIFHSALPANTPGTYALYGPGFDPASLPATVTRFHCLSTT
jgi:hypothetical protein